MGSECDALMVLLAKNGVQVVTFLSFWGRREDEEGVWVPENIFLKADMRPQPLLGNGNEGRLRRNWTSILFRRNGYEAVAWTIGWIRCSRISRGDSWSSCCSRIDIDLFKL